MAVKTFESLLENTSFMKSVFAAMEAIRQEEYLSPDMKSKMQRSQVEAIYGSHGIQLTDEQYYHLVDYCDDAEDVVNELSDDEASLLAAGLDSLNNVSKQDIRNAANQLRQTANALDNCQSLV